eukprot:6194877-Amphidinium_carterae.1
MALVVGTVFSVMIDENCPYNCDGDDYTCNSKKSLGVRNLTKLALLKVFVCVCVRSVPNVYTPTSATSGKKMSGKHTHI